MKSTYTIAEVYTITAVCKTPLRTGNDSGSLETILYDSDGSAMIQGSSIAGAFRAWCEKKEFEEVTNLFGSRDNSGHLIFSDAIFKENTNVQQRPRTRMNSITGSVDDGGKYDVLHIAADSVFEFSITWLGTEEIFSETEVIEHMLAALDSGVIKLGAYKTNGFGRVSVDVVKQSYNLKDEKGRKEWLEESAEKKKLKLMSEKQEDNVVFTIDGDINNLLVKSSYPVAMESGEGSKIVNISENGRMILPASSIKGVVRSRVEAIAKYLNICDAENVVGSIFGNNDMRGNVYFEDVILDLAPKCQARIRLNYFTGSVKSRALFNEEPLSGNIKIVIKADIDYKECALILLALRDLGLGLYNIGSGSAIGRGYFGISSLTAECKNAGKISLLFDKEKNVNVDDPDKLLSLWLKELRENRNAETDKQQ